MAEAITFDDPEPLVVAYLTAALAERDVDAPVSTWVPSDRPDLFVRVMRTGGAPRTIAHADAYVTVECWATRGTDEAASDLARLCFGLMSALDTESAHVPAGPRGVVGLPVSLPDPDSSASRYVFTRVVRLRAHAL